jgi:threonylcarbamoyladenosine tRNA methylthiotransferase MtaB
VKYSIVTFGCRVNQAESLGLEGELLSCGGEAVPADLADLVVVNTCSVTAAADQGARQAIRRIARANPAAKIVVTGCYATRRPADLCNLPGVARLVPNHDKDRLGETVRREVGLMTAERAGAGEGDCRPWVRPGVRGRTACLLQVQTGCDEACSYCAIPATRGPSRSRPLEAIVSEADCAARAGFRELILTGVHLGAYGRDLEPPRSLADLLRALASCGGDMSYRLSSIEPMDCTPDVVDLVAGSGRFAPHFHLPLQHASDRMLHAMRRPYSLAFFRRLVDAIRDRLPDAAIGTDLIVGFPGETDSDFVTCVELLNDLPLALAHVFCYSDRPGTTAAAMTPKVHGETVKKRAEALRGRARDVARRFQLSQVGHVRRGLTLADGTLVLTDNYLKVRIPPGLSRNERVTVRLLGVGDPMAGVVDGEGSGAPGGGGGGGGGAPAPPPPGPPRPPRRQHIASAALCAGDRLRPSTMSCPHAARISRPRLLRTDTVTP